MKKSELKNEIKNYIYEILSEDEAYELTGTTGTKTVASFKSKGEADKFKQQNPNVKAVKKLEEVEVQSTDPAVKKIEDKMEKDPEFLKKTKEAMAKAEKGDTTDLAIMMAGFGKMFESEEKDSTESYAVILKGGSIGDKNNKPIKTFNTPEEAKEFAKRRNQQLSPGEKSYYKMSYNVIKLPKNLNEEEDSTPDDETIDKQAKAAAKKEKIQGPSKFKIPNSEFEDFKTKLNTLVKKIKAMDSGDEKTKKMAALKQFIKKPELVKAFKERDVKIDTDGLVD